MKKTNGVKGSTRLPLSKEVLRMLRASDIKQVAGGDHPSCQNAGTCGPKESGPGHPCTI
jgi:hypothetical protein